MQFLPSEETCQSWCVLRLSRQTWTSWSGAGHLATLQQRGSIPASDATLCLQRTAHNTPDSDNHLTIHHNTEQHHSRFYSNSISELVVHNVAVNTLVSMNEVKWRRVRLVLGWVTGRQTATPPRYATSHPGQLSLAIPPWVGATNTNESWGVNRHTVQCTSPVSTVWQCKLALG